MQIKQFITYYYLLTTTTTTTTTTTNNNNNNVFIRQRIRIHIFCYKRI